MPKSNPPSESAGPNLAEAVALVAIALSRNKNVAILPGQQPGTVLLCHRHREGGTFNTCAVAAVLVSGGDLDAYFNEKF